LGTKPLTAINPPSASSHVLDRRPWVIPLLLVLLPLIGHLPSVILGVSSNPIWTQSGAVLGVGQPWLAGLQFADPNVGWTNQALGYLAAQDWLHGRIPWWNPYSGIGLPLAGEMQPAAMFLPFVLLLGFQGGIVWLEITLQIFAGLMTFCLLRRLDLGRVSALIGALLFEFNGTFTVVPGETILNVLPFLPMLLLGIEYARDAETRRRAVVVIALAIGGSLLAGFPEAAYIDGLLALLWTICRFIGNAERLKFALIVAIGGILGLMLAAPQIVAFFDFAILTNIFQAHTLGQIALDPRGAAQVIIPFVYGPLGSSLGNDLLSSISGGTGGYIGAAALLFAVMGALSGHDRPIAVILVFWLVLSAGKTFGIPPIMHTVNLLPFMKDIEFFRYAAPAWELAVVILIARALDQLDHGGWRYGIGLTGALVALFASFALAWPWASAWHWSDTNRAIMLRWLWREGGFQIAAIILISLLWLRFRSPSRRAMAGGALVAYAMAMFAVPQLSGVRPGRVDVAAIDYLKTHSGLDRFYTVGPIQPNYSAYFSIPNVNHNYLPVALKWTTYIEKSLFPSAASQNGDIFWAPFPPMQITTAINDVQRYIKNYRFLGVRYIVASPGVQLTSTISIPNNRARQSVVGLGQGQSLTLSRIAPAVFSKLGPISEIGIFQGNYGNTATGILSVSVCARSLCSTGSANLDSSADNSAFHINISPPLTINPGDRLSVTINHATGSHPDAIWLWPGAGPDQSLKTSSGQTLKGQTVQLVFNTGSNRHEFTHVYADQLMDIWRVRHADNFYTTNGSACTLRVMRLNSVIAQCSGPDALVRRELFMPGWHATINGAPVMITPDHDIVQKISLKPGENRIRFHFAPPFSQLAWLVFWLSVVALLAVQFSAVYQKRRPSRA
jgi:hypothetical protein